MKFSNNKLILLLVSTFLFLAINSFTVKTRSKTMESKLGLMTNNGTAGNSTSAGGNSTPALPGSNVVGKDDLKSRIPSQPYTVSKCDQILEIQAETLDDINNFLIKSPKFFTMSMYSLNQFSEKKVTSFEQLISLGGLTTVPQIITGSVSCIEFKSYYRNITLCTKTEDEARSIISAFQSFMKCRIGDNLRKKIESPKSKMQTILNKACMGLNISFDDTKYKNPIEAEAALNMAIDNTLRNLASNADKFIIPINATNAQKESGWGQTLK